MAEYRISGVWKDGNDVITAYAFHEILKDGTTRAAKKTKMEAIRLLEIKGNSAKTWVWNYTTCFWHAEAIVEVVDSPFGKYLRSDRDKKTTDNLAHLINCDWFIA